MAVSNTEFMALMRQYNFMPEKATADIEYRHVSAYGEIYGIATQITYYKNSLIFMVHLQPKELLRIFKPLKSALKGTGKVKNLYDTVLMIECAYKPRSSSFRDFFANTADVIEQFMVKHDVQPGDVCPICGGDECDSAFLWQRYYRFGHLECLEESHETTTIKTPVQKRKKQSVLLGLIGGVIGCIIGCIPTLFTVWSEGAYYSIFFALIPIGFAIGYRIKGKRGSFALFLNCISSLIIVILMQFAMLSLVIAREGGPSGLVSAYLSDPYFVLGVIFSGETAHSILFLVGGLATSFPFISFAHAESKLDTYASLASLRPRNAETLPPDIAYANAATILPGQSFANGTVEAAQEQKNAFNLLESPTDPDYNR